MKTLALAISFTLLVYAGAALFLPQLPGFLVLGERWIFLALLIMVLGPTCWYLLDPRWPVLRWIALLLNAVVGLLLWLPIVLAAIHAGSELPFLSLLAAIGLVVPFAINVLALTRPSRRGR